jgi:branched-chain amino acid transport system substrate-binding protein
MLSGIKRSFCSQGSLLMRVHDRFAFWKAGIGMAAIAAMLLSGSAIARAGSQPYRFAVLGPFSGDNAVYGVGLRNGTELAVKEINAAGGIKGGTVVLDFLDTQCEPTQAASAAAKVASDPSYFAVIGDVCSGATMAAIPILARSGSTEISGDSTSPKITAFVEKRHYTNFARTIISDTQQAEGMVKLARDVLRKTRVGILYASDDFGQPIFALQKKMLETGAAQLVDAETYTPSTTKDFTPQLTRLAAAKPDVILLDGYYNDAGTAVSQMARSGLSSVTLIASEGIDQSGYMTLGGAATEGTYIFTDYSPDNTLPANVAFVRAYMAAYGVAPNEQAAYGYEIPFIFAKAIEAGATETTLAKTVKSMIFTGPTGTTRFDTDGDVVGKYGAVTIVRNGKMQFDEALTKAVSE